MGLCPGRNALTHSNESAIVGNGLMKRDIKLFDSHNSSKDAGGGGVVQRVFESLQRPRAHSSSVNLSSFNASEIDGATQVANNADARLCGMKPSDEDGSRHTPPDTCRKSR